MKFAAIFFCIWLFGIKLASAEKFSLVELSDYFNIIMGWADEVKMLSIRTNAETPLDSKTAREFGAEGIGLCRTEHMFFEEEEFFL